MPFTPAHIVAAFPFRRSRLVWSALIVGTIAPDLEYFLRLAPGQPYGHTLPGLFLITLPLALVTLWLFHAFVKSAFIALLPEGLERRLAVFNGKFQFGGAARLGLIVASVLIGALTHLAWDSFTHGNTWLVRDWPALRHPVHVRFPGAVPLYKLLQHGSTLLGLTVLAVWIAAWYRSAKPCNPRATRMESAWPVRRIMTLLVIAAIAMAAGITYAVAVVGVPTRHSSIPNFVGPLVVTAMAAAWWQFVLLGLVRSRRKKNEVVC